MYDYDGDSISESEWNAALDEDFYENQEEEIDYESDDPLTMAILDTRDD